MPRGQLHRVGRSAHLTAVDPDAKLVPSPARDTISGNNAGLACDRCQMRTIPLLTAIVVAIALYGLVFERDRVFQAAGVEPDKTGAAVPQLVANDLPAGTVRVVAITSTAQTVDSAITLRGRTEAARHVTVSAETSGTVISDPIRKGAQVFTGDVLCKLDPGTRQASLAEARARLTEAKGRIPEAEAAIAEARARIREAEINVTAARQLSQDGFASEARLVSAEAVLQAAQAGEQRARSAGTSADAAIEAAGAGVAAAEREIERLVVTAPFDGLLETDTAELGTLMQPGAACAQIVQLDPIKLVGFVPETKVDRIDLGASVTAQLVTGAKVSGTVSFLSRSADPATRTFRVEVTATNPNLAIRDGQTADISVSSSGRDAHLVPQSALTLNDNGELGIRFVDNTDTARFAKVTLLRDTIDGVWLAGLPPVIDIITVGQEFVVDGVPVAVTYAEATQ